MSAQPAPLTAPPLLRPTPLQAVPARKRKLAQLPFVLIVAVLLGGGMTGVLLLSTTIQSQSAELGVLQAREADLRYQEAALVATVQDLRSTQNLAEQAWGMGMRPNPNPAFIQMPEGTVVGVPTPVTGNELPGIVPPAPPAPVVEEPAEAPSQEPATEQPATQEPAAAQPDADANPSADAASAQDGATQSEPRPEPTEAGEEATP